MTNNLKVEFLGLTSVVARRSGERIQSCLMVLPDLTKGLYDKRLPVAKLKGYAPPHVAAVIVPSKSVINQSGKYPAMKFQTAEGRFNCSQYSMYLLEQEKLTFSMLGETSLDLHERPVDPDKPDTHTPNSEADAQGVQWIPRLKLANHRKPERNAGMFHDSGFLNADSTPKDNGDKLQLVGTVPIETGRFYVDDVVPKDGELSAYGIYVPTKHEKDWEQSIYSRIFWENPFEGDRLNMNFSDGNGGRSSVLIGAEYGQCDVLVANLELEGLLELGSETPRYTDADLDFAISYLFCKDVPMKKHGMPVPHGVRWILGGSSPRCKSAMFESE